MRSLLRATVIVLVVLTACGAPRHDSTAPSETTTSTTSTTSTSTSSSTTTTATTVPAPLMEGASGPEVLALQLRLEELGYWLATADGRFDMTTTHAVTAFQK